MGDIIDPPSDPEPTPPDVPPGVYIDRPGGEGEGTWKGALGAVRAISESINKFFYDTSASVDGIIGGFGLDPESTKMLRAMIPDIVVIGPLLAVLGGLVNKGVQLSTLGEIVGRQALYGMNVDNRTLIPDYRDLARLAFREPAKAGLWNEAGRKAGLDDRWLTAMSDLVRPLQGPDELAAMATRQIITPAEYAERLKWLGADPKENARRLELAYQTPGWDVIWDLWHRGVLPPDVYELLKATTGTHPDLAAIMERAQFTLLDVDAVTRLWQRGLCSPDAAVERIAHLGINPADARNVLDLGCRVLDLESVRTLYLRGKITESDVSERLLALGVRESDLGHYTTLWNPTEPNTGILPPFQDVIHMAIRDVFDPYAVSRYGLDSHYPSAVNEFARMTGVAPFWAQKYWAAHWVMPGPAQARQMMFLSDRFSETDLRNLYRYADYPPGLIDAMMDATYNPLTRVDTRRMHAVGVLSVSDVKESYLRLGFNEQDAQRMTDFTVAYNEDETVVGAKGHILQGVEEYILTEAEASGMLVAIGLSSQVAGDLVMSQVVERELKAEADLLNTIERLYVRGAIPESEARQRLATRGYGADRIGALMERFNNSRERAVRLPTRATLDRWFTEGIIDGQDYMDRMGRLGYRVEDATLYLRSAMNGKS